ncbi:MAG: hypothetical protein IJB32_01985 [Clostridia bacterium]|nr:hypothetical protein [Clostridia bacterium]
MSKKPKVLFTFVEAGMGHIIPMRGISNAFKEKYGDKCEIIDSYIFTESEHEQVKKMGKELSDHTIRASVNWFYNKFEALSYLLSSKTTLRFLDLHFNKKRKLFYSDLNKINPDLIVSSYYLPSHLARQANEKGYTDTLIATYSPDPYIYPSWDRKCDLFLVNNENAFNMAINGGFHKEKVKKVPCIYKKEIIETRETKDSARHSLAINNDKFTVLYTGGAYGTKGTEKLIKALLCSGLNINLIVVCGKNKKIYDNMTKLSSIKGNSVDYEVIGFTERLHDYITASDIVIGKAGSNTMMEVAKLNRPLIVFRESSRLEEKTAEFFVKEETALRIRSPKKIVKFIDECIKNPEKLSTYTKNCCKYQDQTGATQVADLLFELLKTRFKDL